MRNKSPLPILLAKLLSTKLTITDPCFLGALVEQAIGSLEWHLQEDDSVGSDLE